MTDGIFVCPEGPVEAEHNWIRPRSKKQLRDLVEKHPDRVRVEYTGVLHEGDRFQLAINLGTNREIYFVGPDPFRNRKFYGRITTDLDGRARVT